MTGIPLASAMALLLIGQANLPQAARDFEAQQFIAADPVLRVSADSPPAEAKAESAPTARPRFYEGPKIVAPRLVAAPKKVVTPKGEARQRKAIRLKHAPAVDIGNTISEFLRGEAGNAAAAAIVADALSNTLLISAAPDTVEQIISVVEILDRKPASIQIDGVLLQVTRDSSAKNRPADLPSRTWKDGASAAIEELGQRGMVRVLARPSLLTVDGQAGFVQVGQREPRITGVRESSQGRANQVEVENVGLILGVTARANDDDWITMEIDLEDSRIRDEQQGMVLAVMSDGEVVRSPGVDVATMQSTICVRNGQAVTLGSVVEQRSDRYTELWMVIEARLVD